MNFPDEYINRLLLAGSTDETYGKAREKVSDHTDFTLDHGAVLYRNRLWIPEGDTLREEILHDEHDSQLAGHMGQDKTTELIKRNYYWPGMDVDIADYVRSCDQCQRNKSSRHRRYGLLQPLELAVAPWTSLSMDFITELPESNGYSEIWVIIDRFSKMAHFIPLKKGEKSADHLARIFLKEVWRFHGLPNNIVSDRDSRFSSTFWKALMRLLGIDQKMSTAYHPQTDGQTERVNQSLEAYLRFYTNYEQDDWSEMLPMAEFAYNNSATTATQMSPFYVNYGFHPRSNWPRPDENIRNPVSRIYAHWIKQIHDQCREQLERTRGAMGRYYDKRRHSGPKFKPGDLVMVDGRNIKTKRACKKLDHKMHGPFEIDTMISSHAARIRLPGRWRVHNVFHVSLLEPYRQSQMRKPIDPKAVLQAIQDIEDQEYYDIDEIMASTWDVTQSRVLYLVKWDGWPDRKDWTEEPFEHFSDGGLKLLVEFHRNNPRAPKDHRVRL